METSSMNRENDVWSGVFSRIKEAMGKRTASDAVLYVLTHDKIPYLLPINLVGAKDLAADLSSKDKIKYVGFILVTYRKQGPPACEFLGRRNRRNPETGFGWFIRGRKMIRRQSLGGALASPFPIA